ncbi:hypothetical protein FHW00_004782 [Ochrobactrum sp. P6BSIII]|uniref:hypothetical protein n=1 Tax=unclassified Ochrobactrum TaxID=239106 RepID=UPI0011178E24|nr:hypothetical protein [Ochrobactrum sp. P6BSIII]
MEDQTLRPEIGGPVTSITSLSNDDHPGIGNALPLMQPNPDFTCRFSAIAGRYMCWVPGAHVLDFESETEIRHQICSAYQNSGWTRRIPC